VRSIGCAGNLGYRVLYEVIPDTGRNETAGDVRVLRMFGQGQDRRSSDPVRRSATAKSTPRE